MHELSIALSMLDIAAEESEKRDGAAVREIHIRLGVLSGVVKEALQSAFDLARESSPFADCQLLIEDAPLTSHCLQCKIVQPVEFVQQMRCAVCGEPVTELVGGMEMEIKAMAIDDLSNPIHAIEKAQA